MSENQLAFFTRDTACPICDQIFQQRHIRLRAVTPLHKESDQHVIEYKWSSPRIHQVHPPFYFLHFCPNCFYTDVIEDFAAPDDNDFSVWVLKSYKVAHEISDPILKLIADGVDYDDINFDSAMRIHMLAAYQQLLSPPEFVDSYKLGRLFLRIAWLYREQVKSEPTSDVSPPSEPVVDEEGSNTTDLKDVVLKGFNHIEQLVYASASKWESLGKIIQQDVESRFDEKEVPFKEALDTVAININSLLEQVKTSQTSYLHHVASEQQSLDERISSTEYSMSDAAFVGKLKLLWPLAPSDEKEAMRMAVNYFEKALSSDPRFDSMEAYFRVASLAVDLLMRCGEIDSAFGFVRGIHSSCMDTRQVYMGKLKEPGLKPDRKKKIQMLIKRNNATLECALDLRIDLMNKLVERERPRIEGIINKNPDHSGKALEEALIASGIPNGIINHIKDPKNKNGLASTLLRK